MAPTAKSYDKQGTNMRPMFAKTQPMYILSGRKADDSVVFASYPILDPNQCSRGRPCGSRRRKSRCIHKCVCVDGITNFIYDFSQINLFVANPATTPHPVGTTPNRQYSYGQ